jgi:hypothetical protein
MICLIFPTFAMDSVLFVSSRFHGKANGCYYFIG